MQRIDDGTENLGDKPKAAEVNPVHRGDGIDENETLIRSARNYSAPNNFTKVEHDSALAIGTPVVVGSVEHAALETLRDMSPFAQQLALAMLHLLHEQAPKAALAEYIASLPDTADKAAWTPQFPTIIANWETSYGELIEREGGAA